MTGRFALDLRNLELAMIPKLAAVAALIALLVCAPAIAAAAPDLTACGIVTAADARRFVGAPLDVTLHFLDSPEEMKNIYANSLEEYRRMVRAPDAPYKNATIAPLGGFGDQAFVLQAVTDPKTGYKSTLIVFYKGAVGGSVAAWKKPEPSLETPRAVLRHILSRLP